MLGLAWATGCTAVLGIDEDYVFDPSLETVGGGGGTTPTGCPAVPDPPGGNCPAECTRGCTGTTCLIACLSDQECADQTIVCPADFDCVLACQGQRSCEGATLQCQDDYTCSVSCEEDRACVSLTVECGSGPCDITCGDFSLACSGATLQCGPQRCTATCDGSDRPAVQCGSTCQCEPC